MSAAFMRAMAPLAGRVQLMISRGTLSAIDDKPAAQELQLELLEGEVQDGVERFQGYGFTSVPHPGAEAVFACAGGLRSHGFVLQVEDRRYRLTGLEAGEVAIFDDQGQKIVLKRDGIRIESSLKVEIDAPEVHVTADSATIDSADIALGGMGGQPVARVGDTVSGGVITSGSSKVRAA